MSKFESVADMAEEITDLGEAFVDEHQESIA